MKLDHDYVAFADYENDTRELANTAAAALEYLRRQKMDAEGMLWAAVHAAGGKLSIPRNSVIRGKPENWRVDIDDCNDCIVLRIDKEKPRQP